MMEQLKEDSELQKLLSSFSCEQDEDIETFLYNNIYIDDNSTKYSHST